MPGGAPASAGDAALRLVVRSYQRQPDAGMPWAESSFHHVEWPVELPVRQTALVLVDVWDTHVIASHAARTADIARTRIAPAVAAAREIGIAVIHAPSPVQARRYPQWTRYADEADHLAPAIRTWPFLEADDWPPPAFRRREGPSAQYRRPQPAGSPAASHEREERRIYPSVEPASEDFVVATGEQLHRLCRGEGLLHLVFAGFAANICIPFKDYGIRACRARGYNCILLRDATTAIEGHDTLDDFGGTRQAVRELEMADLAASATSAAFVGACKEVRSARAVT